MNSPGGQAEEAPAVESVEVAAYRIPTDRPESDGTLEWDSTTAIVVELGAGELTGIGYTYGHPAVAGVIASTLAPLLEGADPLAPPRAWARMQAAVRNAGREGVCAMAISALDIALWDLASKLAGLPLADALGRCREAIPAYGSGGFTSYTDAELAGQLEGFAAQGFKRVKIKVGRDPGADPRRLGVARRAVGDDVGLMVDANGAFTPREAAGWAERYAEAGVEYFEEPVPSDDLAGLRRLREGGPPGIAIAAGEYAWDLPQLDALSGCVDILQADATRCAGPTNVRRADGICRARHLPFSAHCAPQVSAHLCCAMERAVHVEYFHDHSRVEALLFDGAIAPDGGLLRPDRGRPGLGVELRRADAERFRI
jgi:L-alanine-DL-glutamate epimerase-like enolase superfamily enzyme